MDDLPWLVFDVNETLLDLEAVAPLFERQFSVDDVVHRYKPAQETYRHVERELDLPPSRLCLVACHVWDTLGAAAVGWNTALILRHGNAPLGLGR